MAAQALERPRAGVDRTLFNCTLALLVIGVVMVYDASYAQSLDRARNGHDGLFFLKREAAYAGIGFVAMIALARTGFWRLRRFAGPLLLTSVLLLCAVWVPHLGVHRNGAARWVGWGVAQFQPSELAKLSVVIYLSGLLAVMVEHKRYDIRKFMDGLLAPLAVVGLIVLLVEREPDLGTALVIGLTGITLFSLAGARRSHLAAICAIGGASMLGISMLHGFRNDRLIQYVGHKEDLQGKGYQTGHGKIAVGSGELVGLGLGAGREKYYLPEANTDFIFATIAEETGFAGSSVVIGLLFLVGWRGMVIARRTKDKFGALLAAGIAAVISWQAIINVSVVTGLLPATGVPLPCISFGGTSLVFTLASIGILLNIGVHPQGRETPVAERRPTDGGAGQR